MAQNRSTAVMARRVEPHDSLDYFPTPPWATRALCEHLKKDHPLHRQVCWEPACGEGWMARPLAEYFAKVHATDVHDYSASWPGQDGVCDFLIDWGHAVFPEPVHWVITNPPFRLAEEFIRMALSVADVGVAVLVRTSFLEGQERFRRLFSQLPPAMVLQFVERVGIFRGRIDQYGSTATAYCWLIWLHADTGGTAFHWLPPCRSDLERQEDYPAQARCPEPMPLFEETAA